MIKGKSTDLKVLRHGIFVDNGGQIRAEGKLRDLITGYMNLLKDLGPTE